MNEPFVFTAQSEDKGMQIDKLLSEKLGGVTRSHIQKLIDEGCVLLCGMPVKANYKLKDGDEISVGIARLRSRDCSRGYTDRGCI